MCRAYYSNPFLAQVARESIDILRDFESWSGGGYSDYRTTGLLFLHPPEDAADLGANARMLEAVGTRVELLEPDRIADLVPGIDASALDHACGSRSPALRTRAAPRLGCWRWRKPAVR
jgi:glycine/D-amino acid oxidase-like deaminating enzyme